MQSTRRPIEDPKTRTRRLIIEKERLEEMLEQPFAPDTKSCILEVIEDLDYMIEWRKLGKRERAHLVKRKITPFNGRWTPDADES